MLNHLFSNLLSEIQKKIMIYLAEKLASDSQFIGFDQLLNDMNWEAKSLVSKFELIKALEVLEKNSLIEAIKDPITEEISFNLEPVIRKYIKTDPLRLIHTSNTSASPNLAMPTAASYAS